MYPRPSNGTNAIKPRYALRRLPDTMWPRLAVPANASSSLRQIRKVSPSVRSSNAANAAASAGGYDHGRWSLRLALTAFRYSVWSVASNLRR
jgi:hypothetical protein